MFWGTQIIVEHIHLQHNEKNLKQWEFLHILYFAFMAVVLRVGVYIFNLSQFTFKSWVGHKVCLGLFRFSTSTEHIQYFLYFLGLTEYSCKYFLVSVFTNSITSVISGILSIY